MGAYRGLGTLPGARIRGRTQQTKNAVDEFRRRASEPIAYEVSASRRKCLAARNDPVWP